MQQPQHVNDVHGVLMLFSHVPLSGSLADARAYVGVYHHCADQGDSAAVFELLCETMQLGYDDVRCGMLSTYDLSQPEIASALYLRALALTDARTGERHVASLHTTATLDRFVDTLPDETPVYDVVLHEAAYPPIWRVTRCAVDCRQGCEEETRDLGLDIFERYAEPSRSKRARRSRTSASSSTRRASASSRRHEQPAQSQAQEEREPSLPLSVEEQIAALALPFDEETGKPIVSTPVLFGGIELQARLLARVTPFLADHHHALRAGDDETQQ